MRVLIAGCGYVGLPLGTELARQGHEVFGLRRMRLRDDAFRGTGVHPLLGDITDPKSLSELPANWDWVVNCVSAGGSTPEDYRKTYLEGTRNLLRWLGGKPPGKFVYTSSTGVYGQSDGSEVDETSQTEPGTPTGDALVATEQLLLDAANTQSFPGVILRVAGIYGPERGYWLKQFVSGEARIEGDGSRVLNMIHRDDVAGAIQIALNRGRPGGVYNAVDDEPVTQLEFFKWLAGKLGRPMPPAASETQSQPRRRGTTNKRVSNRKLRAELGWVPIYPTFREGFAEPLTSALTPA